MNQTAYVLTAIAIIAALITMAAACSENTAMYSSRNAAQSSPTPAPTAIPQLKVAPYEPTF
jgi:hypothetical protein